jgi:CD109 antigen
VARDAVTFAVGVSTTLSVDVAAGEESYYPRDTVDIGMAVSRSGEPVIAALGISAVDEAVYEVGSMFSGFEEIIFGLDEQFIEPQYQLLTYVYTGAGSLPSESDSVVSELDEARMASTWLDNAYEAEALKNDAIRGYWYAVYLCLGVSAIAFVGSRARVRRRGPIALLIVLSIVITAGGAAVVFAYVSTLGFGSPSGPVPLLPRAIDNELVDRFELDAGAGLDFGDTAYSDDDSDYQQDSSISKPTVVRQYFPETWYWNPCLVTDEDGQAEVSLTAPDSITSWKVDVIASTSDGVVGSGSTSVTVFQPFFVEPDVPVSVVRGDEFPLKILVYNYLDAPQTVNVTLADEPWCDLISDQEQAVVVPANYVSSVSFTIVADKVGWHTVSVFAESANASDSVVRPIKVTPDGRKVETLFNGELQNNSVTEELVLYPDRIEGSENAWVKIQGGVDAVFLEGVDEFIRHVSGCGEQSLSMLSIDILAYDTVMRIGATPEKMFEYESIVNQGIQHELMYLVEANNGEGRGIVWFPGDQDVHPWLTSWGLIAFQDAINAGFGLDEDIVADMQSWLMSIQRSDGSWEFPDWGIYEFNNPLLRSKEIAATGYIARSLLHSGVPGSDTHILKAVEYVESNVGDVWDDPFSLALSLLLLQSAYGDDSLRQSIADRLEQLRKVDGDTYFWTSPTNLISDAGAYTGSDGGIRAIETTGYAAMALAGEPGHASSADGAIRYLLNNRGALGGWHSTQDTVVAFHALRQVGSANVIENVTVEVSVDGVGVETLDVDEFQRDLTFLVDLRPYLSNASMVTVECAGVGSVLYSIYLEQYVPWPEEAETSEFLTLTVTYDTTNISVTDTVTAHLFLLYDGLSPIIKMILVDLRAPIGLSFVTEEFDLMISSGVISSFDSNDRQVVVYLTDLSAGLPVEFDYSLVADMPIKSTLQGISAWDMYDPEGLWSETIPVDFEVT